MVSRERILEAAGRVYAKHGFRGATTRLIAAEAGVNEVTLFRTFGSKGALFEAVLEQSDVCSEVNPLPDPAVDPEEELTIWVGEHLQRIHDLRPMLIQAISELDERPEVADFACRGRDEVHEILTDYSAGLQRAGRADSAADVFAAVTMLISSVMGDAMGRPMVPESFPPIDEAPRRYVRCFLRSIGVASSR
ncbi:MAG: TetR/AcrR family transcriptional regulator [bacterium]